MGLHFWDFVLTFLIPRKVRSQRRGKKPSGSPVPTSKFIWGLFVLFSVEDAKGAFFWIVFHVNHSLLNPKSMLCYAKSLQSCLTLCDPIDGSPPGSPVPGILQARTLEWVAISFSNAWNWKAKVKFTQSCPTPSDPMDCSLPGSSVHGIFQARVLEWGAIAFSEGMIELYYYHFATTNEKMNLYKITNI